MSRLLEVFFGEWQWVRRYVGGTWVHDPRFGALSVTWVKLSEREIAFCGGIELLKHQGFHVEEYLNEHEHN